MRYIRAIVQLPSKSLVDGLTSVDLGVPDISRALEQHSAYCDALEQLGVQLIVMPADSRFPDATFVEDTALVIKDWAILTHPGAATRKGEVEVMRRFLNAQLSDIQEILSPGTVDAGDVLEADGHYYVGLSERTNLEGAIQLIGLLDRHGLTGSTVEFEHFLHLKSGVAYLGANMILIAEQFAGMKVFAGYDRIIVPAHEAYAANALAINGTILLAAGFPETERRVRSCFSDVLLLEMSEFEKVDGGLSCLSLRFW